MTDIMDIPTLPDDVELVDIKACNGHFIRSGEAIELTTSDPENGMCWRCNGPCSV